MPIKVMQSLFILRIIRKTLGTFNVNGCCKYAVVTTVLVGKYHRTLEDPRGGGGGCLARCGGLLDCYW
jgi:hypothetical protein